MTCMSAQLGTKAATITIRSVLSSSHLLFPPRFDWTWDQTIIA